MATNATQSTDETVSEQLDDRDCRALTECMTVLPKGGSLFEVTTESGSSYTVDAKRDRCECADAQHNLPDGDREACKHRARIAFATGERAIPGWVDMSAVDDLLGEQLPNSEPRVAMADGGRLFSESRLPLETEEVDGGALVYRNEDDDLGRELVGFTHPDGVEHIRWDKIRDELARLGLGVGAIHHKETYDPQEVGL
jgi:hypothetical protein